MVSFELFSFIASLPFATNAAHHKPAHLRLYDKPIKLRKNNKSGNEQCQKHFQAFLWWCSPFISFSLSVLLKHCNYDTTRPLGTNPSQRALPSSSPVRLQFLRILFLSFNLFMHYLSLCLHLPVWQVVVVKTLSANQQKYVFQKILF